MCFCFVCLYVYCFFCFVYWCVDFFGFFLFIVVVLYILCFSIEARSLFTIRAVADLTPALRHTTIDVLLISHYYFDIHQLL